MVKNIIYITQISGAADSLYINVYLVFAVQADVAGAGEGGCNCAQLVVVPFATYN